MNCLRLFVLVIAAALAGCAAQSERGTTQASRPFAATDTSSTIDLTRPAEDVWERIRLGFAVPNLDTELVDHWTQYYAARPESLLIMSQRAGKYLYHIVDELERRGLPTELALLPFVESAFNPTALSRSQASGLWQFIPSTGRYYNLEQDWWRDMRRDPIASTNAALDYLSYLYEFQGDWYLALASYNWGEGSVRRALERNEKQGLPLDYRALNMPEETRNYVPKLQAFKNIIAEPERFGITLPAIRNTPYFTTVKKKQNIDVSVAAQLAEISVDEFLELNPSHKRPIIKVDEEADILLPADKADIFMENLRKYQGRLSAWTTYRSKKGESFAAIARKFGVPIEQLRNINGLSSRQTAAASETTLLVPAADTGTHVAAADATAEPAATATPRPGAIRPVAHDTGSQPGLAPQSGKSQVGDIQVLRRNPQAQTHVVKRGDTLFALARRYNTTVSALRQLNNLKGNNLAVGKRLRVPGSNIRG